MYSFKDAQKLFSLFPSSLNPCPSGTDEKLRHLGSSWSSDSMLCECKYVVHLAK